MNYRLGLAAGGGQPKRSPKKPASPSVGRWVIGRAEEDQCQKCVEPAWMMVDNPPQGAESEPPDRSSGGFHIDTFLGLDSSLSAFDAIP